MTKLNEVYKCELCGVIAEVLHEGAGSLVCCGKPMVLQKENTVEASKEKHIPVSSSFAGGVKVTVGSVAHPMEPKHFIEWIEVLAGDQILRKQLKPGDKPEASFQVSGVTAVRAYCNLHGLWKA